jgi:hypothetical protein
MTKSPLDNQYQLPTPKISTGIERVFRRVSPHGQTPVIYREFMLHFLHFMAPDGTKLKTKIDKTVPGSFYREAGPGEHSPYGEYTYTFPEDGITRRIIAVLPNKF